jgi:uncharacterized protein YoxC
MNETQIITILLSLVATFFGLLVVILGWIGNKVYGKLDDMARTMHNIETDLHGKIGILDRRVTRVEEHVFMDRRGIRNEHTGAT